jgi:molybdopterin/thiamine biosynthesis adenylyltransferase/molybdopterin synthase catalytic subunit
MFSISNIALDRNELTRKLSETKAGAIVAFEGWVRNHNEGRPVSSLEYQVYHELAVKEGQRILAEAREKFNIHDVMAIHREGHLALGEIAIWIGATASHRDDAFKACRFVIDEIKHRLPVWKKEHYLDREPEWVFCRHHHHHVHFDEKEYYAKQASLVAQDKLKVAKVLVVGAGGLGCPVLMALAAAGVGHLTVVDHDTIQISNIHRQFLYTPNLVGEKKAQVAASRLRELNPFISVTAITDFVRPQHLDGIDLVVDCTDTMQTKYFLHDLCFQKGLPLVSASVFRHEGQIRTFKGQGCLRCFTPETPSDHLLGNCNDFGVTGAVTATVGSLQAQEVLTYLQTGTNPSLHHTLLLDLTSASIMKLKNAKRDDCPVCRGEFSVTVEDLEVEQAEHVIDIRGMSDEEVLALKPNGHALCCHRGIRSQKLALELRAQGHHVFSLKGGACSR